MLTAPLKTNIVIGAIQVLNKERAAGTDGEFTDKDFTLLQEVAEYSSALIQRMVDPKFQLSADDTARFIAKLTDLPLVTKLEEIELMTNSSKSPATPSSAARAFSRTNA
jgi:hypothetical protein